MLKPVTFYSEDDSKKYLRRLTVEWGKAPMGCRLTLRSLV
jgi:hypothetical protein